MPGSQDLLDGGEQVGVLAAGRGRVTRRPGEGGEIRPGDEGVGVPGSQDLLDGGEQVGVLGAGRGRLTRRPDQVGEIRPGDEGVGVPGSQDLLDGGEQVGVLGAGRGRLTRRPDLRGQPAGMPGMAAGPGVCEAPWPGGCVEVAVRAAEGGWRAARARLHRRRWVGGVATTACRQRTRAVWGCATVGDVRTNPTIDLSS